MAAEAKTGVELESYQVILRPLVTEKGMHLSERDNTYTFAVSVSATKTDIKRAAEGLWSVRVVSVRTQNRKGKPRRHKMSRGQTHRWKKAIIQLHDDDRIAFF